MDYYFWDCVKEKVYKDRYQPFKTIEEMQERIKDVWEVAVDLDVVQKAISQFRPRLRGVVGNHGGPIKHLFKYVGKYIFFNVVSESK